MSKIYLIHLFFVALIFTSCKKSEDTKSDFFKFVVKDYIRNEDRNWVMIYNSTGTLVGFKELRNNQDFTFDWPQDSDRSPDGKYMVQLLNLTPFSFDNINIIPYFLLNSYSDITPDTWILGNDTVTKPTIIGQNRIMLSGFYDYYYGNVSNGYNLTLCNFFDSFTINQYFNPGSLYLYCKSNLNEPMYYKWIPEVPLNAQYTFDSTQMSKATHYVNLTLPTYTYCGVKIYSEAIKKPNYWERYQIEDFSLGGENSVKIYYPNDAFSSYETRIRLTNNNIYEYNCKYRGTIPDTFEHLQVNNIVNNDEIHQFSTTVTGLTPDVCSFTWQAPHNDNFIFTYTIYKPLQSTITFSAPELPNEILSLYEDFLNLDNLIFYSSSFSDYDTYTNYNAFITNVFTKGVTTNLTSNFYKSKEIYQEGKNFNSKEHKEKLLNIISYEIP